MQKISVMIPNFNRNQLLLMTLESVINQTIEIDCLEIVVVDDCSKLENPEEIVAQFQPRVKLIRNVKNLGQVANLNRCIELANFGLIHILHSDDTVEPTFYERVSRAFDNENVNIVFSSSNYIDDSGVIIGKSNLLSKEEGFLNDIENRLFTEQVIQTPSVVIRTNVYRELGVFRNDFFMVEDWEMWVRLAQSYKFWYIPDFIANYRINSISTSNSNIFNGNFLKDLEKLQNEFYRIHFDISKVILMRENYSYFFIGKADKISGFNNILRHLKYMPSVFLKLKFIYRKLVYCNA